jgi:TRAP-type C4-dicarboxylate transport system substrate-binding protein
MFKQIARCALVAFALSTSPAGAEPINLTFAYFSSDRTLTYLAAIKPFVDAVNEEAAEALRIDVAFSGALGKNPAEQLQLVLDGKADLAFVIPGYTPERFPDNAVMQLPGLFGGVREATLVYTGLIADHALRGYEELFVVGAFATEPETVHVRPPAASLEALEGLRIRSNNQVQGAALERLGMLAVQMPINHASSAIGGGELDGATAAPATLIEFGIARVTPNHYLLGVSSAPLLVVMSREKFDGLPKEMQSIIRKFSGVWMAERYIEASLRENATALSSLQQDPGRVVVVPSPSDLDSARTAFTSEVEAWRAADPGHDRLLRRAQTELDAVRSGALRLQ